MEAKKRTLISCQKMSCLTLEGQRTAMALPWFSGHVNTWTFKQLPCWFVSHQIMPESCALNYLHACLLKMFLHPFWWKKSSVSLRLVGSAQVSILLYQVTASAQLNSDTLAGLCLHSLHHIIQAKQVWQETDYECLDML